MKINQQRRQPQRRMAVQPFEREHMALAILRCAGALALAFTAVMILAWVHP